VSTRSVDDYIQDSHSYYPSLKFPKVGDEVEGDVLDAWMQEKRKYGSNEIETFENGDPKMQLIVNLNVGGEKYTLYTKYAAQLAIFEAVKRSGGRLSQGGRLRIKRIKDGDPPQKGFNPQQKFEAEFTPHKVTRVTSVDDADGGDLEDF